MVSGHGRFAFPCVDNALRIDVAPDVGVQSREANAPACIASTLVTIAIRGAPLVLAHERRRMVVFRRRVPIPESARFVDESGTGVNAA
jgi:hypothetical protein